jgi:hypothetical protein
VEVAASEAAVVVLEALVAEAVAVAAPVVDGNFLPKEPKIEIPFIYLFTALEVKFIKIFAEKPANSPSCSI